MSASRTAWAAGLLCLALVGGCRDRRQADDAAGALPTGEAIASGEAETGRKACAAYADQVCECALKHEDLKPDCDMSRARPQALDLNLRAAMAEGNASLEDRRILIANARKIMRACVEESAELAKRGCPLDLAGGAPAGGAPAAAPTPSSSPAPSPPR